MGIPGFENLLKDCFIARTIKDFKGTSLIIDANQLLFKQCIGKMSIFYDDKNFHINILKSLLDNFKINKIHPIFVFDGRYPAEKRATVQSRKGKILVALNTLTSEKKLIKHPKEKIKYQKKSFFLSREKLCECKKYLTLKGLGYIQCSGESDMSSGSLSEKFDAKVVSDDSDHLLFGNENTTILKNFSFKPGAIIMEISNKNIINYLNELSPYKTKINLDEVINFLALLGSDYSNTSYFKWNYKYIFKVRTPLDLFLKFVSRGADEMLKSKANEMKIYRKVLSIYKKERKMAPMTTLSITSLLKGLAICHPDKRIFIVRTRKKVDRDKCPFS